MVELSGQPDARAALFVGLAVVQVVLVEILVEATVVSAATAALALLVSLPATALTLSALGGPGARRRPVPA